MDVTIPSFLHHLLDADGRGITQLQVKDSGNAASNQLSLSERGRRALQMPAMPECQWLLEWMHAFGYEFVCHCHGLDQEPSKAYVRQRGASAGYTWGKHPSSGRHHVDCPLYHTPNISRGTPSLLSRQAHDHWSPDSPLNLLDLPAKRWRERLAAFQRALIRQADFLRWDRQAIKRFRPVVLCEAARTFRAEREQPLDGSRFTARVDYWLDRQRSLKGDIPMYVTLVLTTELRNDGFWLQAEEGGRFWQPAEVTLLADKEPAAEFVGDHPYMVTLAALRRAGEESVHVVTVAQPVCSEKVWLPVRSLEERRRVREWISLALRNSHQSLFVQAPAELSGGMVFGRKDKHGESHEVLSRESLQKKLYRATKGREI